MSNTKFTTLSHLKSGLQGAKGYIDGQIADVLSSVETLDAAALRGMKVNGTALAIADKMVELLIESGTENGTINVNGVAVGVTGLAKLAYLNEITEDELSEALKASIAAKAEQTDLDAMGVRVTAIEEAGYQTAEQVETIAKAAVAASGHLKKEVVEAVPEAADADANTLYLKLNDETGHYDIYGLVGEEVVLLDDTSVDLSQYSTTEQMNAAISAAFEGIKIGDYAKLDDLNAAVERITAIEAKFDNYYTKEEAEEKFTDETEAQTIAEAAVAAATASDEEVAAAVNEVFGGSEE